VSVAEDDYRDKSPAAGRVGKAIEYLVAASCILVTGGELNVSTSLVDDDGVDLVFHCRGGTATLAVQVKGRTSSSKQVASGGFVAFVRSQTFAPRADLDMLFVAVDVDKAAVMHAWLVPSLEYAETLGEPNRKGRYRFSASTKPDSADQWRSYRLTAAELPRRILTRLGELDGAHSCKRAAGAQR